MSPLSPELTRRQLLTLAASAAAAWQLGPWTERLALAAPRTAPSREPVLTPTLEAFSDTLIPGAKRWPGDRAVTGAASGPGAVQAGAVEMMTFPPADIGPALPALATLANERGEAYAVEHALVLDPTVPPLVALGFEQRTAVLLELLDPSGPDYLLWYALAAMAFLAYHTAGYLHTAIAMRRHHPGLSAIGFPMPDPDGLWRFPVHSYRRVLADEHPGTTRSGSPP